MIKHIENIIIGSPIVDAESIFGIKDEPSVWESEKLKTIWTNERSLPKILGGEFEGSYIDENGVMVTDTINLKFAPSASEVRRNRKDLNIILDNLDYIELKYGKKRLYILVGLKEGEIYEE